MKPVVKPLVLPLFAVLVGLSAAATAQQPAAQQQPRPAAARPAQPAAQPQQQLTPAQQAQLQKQNADMTRAAQQVVALVDANRIGEVWDGASTSMKRAVSRDEFIKQVTLDRNRLGKPENRAQAAVSRAQYPAGQRVPQGLYLNVATPTKFANAPQPVRELVSFRLDEDRTWRVSGYSLR